MLLVTKDVGEARSCIHLYIGTGFNPERRCSSILYILD